MKRLLVQPFAVAGLHCALLAAGSATGQSVILDPVGPPRSWPLEADANLPPITFLPERAKPPDARGMKSWKAMRDEGVVRQYFDYSCGSAALATLLSADGEPVTEAEILRSVFARLDAASQSRVIQEGLSLLDLKTAAEALGRRAEGYRVAPELLARLERPVIVYIEPNGYRHFAVLKGVVADRVFLADPAGGNVRMPIWRFLDMWEDESGQGVVFAVDIGPDSVLAVSKQADPLPEWGGIRQVIRAIEPGFGQQPAPTRFFLE